MFDLQVNGFHNNQVSCNFWDLKNTSEISQLNEFLYKEGIKKYLATLITDSFESICSNLELIQRSLNEESILKGVHIEGGLISRMGVHPEKFYKELNLEKIKELIKKFPGLIKLFTLCPSLDKNGDVTKFLQDSQIKVSYGHSDADFETAWNAFEKYQVDLVTHWGNAMNVYPGFKQRASSAEDLDSLDSYEKEDAGIGLAAYKHPKVKLMLIAGSKKDYDEHLDDKLIKKLFEKKKNQIVLVSDMVHYDGAQAPENLVGGLASLKTHYQNALNLGISKEELYHATTSLPEKLVPLS